MENNEINTAGASASENIGPRSQAATSRPKSKNGSASGPEKGGMKVVASMQTDYLVELAWLQSVYDRAEKAGLETQLEIGEDERGKPVLVINLFGIRVCDSCKSWHAEQACPTCEHIEKGK